MHSKGAEQAGKAAQSVKTGASHVDEVGVMRNALGSGGTRDCRRGAHFAATAA